MLFNFNSNIKRTLIFSKIDILYLKLNPKISNLFNEPLLSFRIKTLNLQSFLTSSKLQELYSYNVILKLLVFMPPPTSTQAA